MTKAVVMEGLEVAFIVVTFGANAGQIGAATLAALVAIIVVCAAGAAVRAPLARVPENSLKFVVGSMLTTFGLFWAGEGAWLEWPRGDLAILGLLALTVLAALGAVSVLRRQAGVATKSTKSIA